MLLVENISSGYGETRVVNQVSINIQQGEIIVIIGPNGCGKSTLLKTIFGLITPYSGKIILNDEDITGSRPYDLVGKGMGFVPQNDNVFPGLTVMENLEIGGYLYKDPDFEEIFRIFPVLREKKNEYARGLSGGERQMLAMARALMARPKLLLLDEPSAGLAPKMVEVMMEKIKEIGKREQSCILLVEQNAKSALRIADRGYIMVMGKKVFEGRADEIIDHKEIGRLYLGHSEKKKVTGALSLKKGSSCRL
ncbi:MAG TPA: ABC transporter ATP-binding protein [Candidatus Methylomirabilis sp.]|nr:ABC transporter ATP-binding protein [Candidatus Methylomirabilis sp.]